MYLQPIRVPEQDCSVELSKTFDDGDKDTSELNFIQSPIEPMDHDANMSRQISTNSLNKAFISDDDFVLGRQAYNLIYSESFMKFIIRRRWKYYKRTIGNRRSRKSKANKLAILK